MIMLEHSEDLNWIDWNEKTEFHIANRTYLVQSFDDDDDIYKMEKIGDRNCLSKEGMYTFTHIGTANLLGVCLACETSFQKTLQMKPPNARNEFRLNLIKIK